MTGNRTIVLSLLAISTVFVAVGLRHTGGAISDTMYLVGSVVAAAISAMVALTFALVAHIAGGRVIRNYAVLVSICSIVVLSVPWSVSKFRLAHTQKTLEAVYDKLASHGPPFPERQHVEVQLLSDYSLLVSHGCWVAEDRQQFEVYYHWSSNSFVLKYPERTWQHCGNNYKGPGVLPPANQQSLSARRAAPVAASADKHQSGLLK